MRTRWLCLAALVAAAGGAGCGGVGTSTTEATGEPLAIYSSLPLQGPSAAISEQIVNGEKLALADAGGRAGRFKIGYVSLDDANPESGQLDPGATATDARMAAQDTSTIAYLGEYSSAATALSLPVINEAGILQVSPASPYVGLTSSLDAGPDEPERFYPSGKRTFGRLQLGDTAQAAAVVKLMQALRVSSIYVLDDQTPFEMPLAQIVAEDAKAAGITVLARESVATTSGPPSAGEIEKIAASGAQAMFFAGGTGAGAIALWGLLHRADPGLLLLGSSSMVDESFTGAIGAAGASTYLTTPLLAMSLYPRSATIMLSDYRRHFGGAPGPWALYGYEAMSVVLDAIRKAGAKGNDRTTVIERFFAIRDRNSVLGRYAIQANGETTLSRYGVDRVLAGRPVFYRSVQVP